MTRQTTRSSPPHFEHLGADETSSLLVAGTLPAAILVGLGLGLALLGLSMASVWQWMTG
jgi:hypothetical protein